MQPGLLAVGEHDGDVVAQRRAGAQGPHGLEDRRDARHVVGRARPGGDRVVVRHEDDGAGRVGAGQGGDDVLDARGPRLPLLGGERGRRLDPRRQALGPQASDQRVAGRVRRRAADRTGLAGELVDHGDGPVGAEVGGRGRGGRRVGRALEEHGVDADHREQHHGQEATPHGEHRAVPGEYSPGMSNKIGRPAVA